MEYAFVGSTCVIRGVAELKALGQRVELADDLAKSVILGNAALIPSFQFDALGFTADELKHYNTPERRMGAPDPFMAKYRKALMALHDNREALKAGRDLPKPAAKSLEVK